ncbi:hypothetical protein [Nocardioides sp.]|uniref:hypothetical protein n=1 Tax=Nocardioides sp. TaxID=35761 RepID=UPI0026338667|nr:hypothetical protein [Nocardioides sp.]
MPEIELHSTRSGRRRRRFAGVAVLLALVVGSAALVGLVVAGVEPAREQPPAVLALPEPPPVDQTEQSAEQQAEQQGGVTRRAGERDDQPGVEEPAEPAPPVGSTVSVAPTTAAVPTQGSGGATPLGSPGPTPEPTPQPDAGPDESPDDDRGEGSDDRDGDERRLSDALSPVESILLEGVGHVAPAAVPVLASAFGLTGHLLDMVEDGLPIRSGAGRR